MPLSNAEKKWISWWTNRISLCTADPATLQPMACTDFDPRNWTDCMWNGGFETLGGCGTGELLHAYMQSSL
jgi:hypothetical protein